MRRHAPSTRAMRRRDLLRLSLAAPAAALLARHSSAQSAKGVSLRLTVKPNRPLAMIPPDFTGLSYESATLSDPDFFAPDNTQLIGFVRRLGSAGVLRVGGNTSEYSVWMPSGVPANARTQPAGPDTGAHAPPRRPIMPLAIRNLRGFLDVTGWRLIYGLNLGTEVPETVADEAAYVAKEMGPKLVSFQLGNEADLFSHNGLRKPDYDFAQFAAEWRRYLDAVRARVPNAPIGGPDTAVNSDWLAQFAKEFGRDVRLLSQHYYAEGPPADPSATIERLLDPQNARLDTLLEGIRRAREAAPNVPFRLTETNSCYGGGKPGVSDTFASALWGLDLMYRMAAAGAAGINFHGGGYGWYSPIVGTREAGYGARPLYYCMLMFAEAGAGELVSATIDNPTAAPLFDAFAVKGSDGVLKAILINKHVDLDVSLTIPTTGSARMLRLAAPSLEDTHNTTFGDTPVGTAGAWSPNSTESLRSQNGLATVLVPHASAALVTFQWEQS
ncbi:MAG TPA: glycosyl hydrolase family protein [Rhizomicrobium sp.]